MKMTENDLNTTYFQTFFEFFYNSFGLKMKGYNLRFLSAENKS